jgi:hypothetical protein
LSNLKNSNQELRDKLLESLGSDLWKSSKLKFQM